MAVWKHLKNVVLAIILTLPWSALAQQSDYTKTRYPIVLVPGAILFDLPFDNWSYWYGIVEALQDGGADVFVTTVPVGKEHTRGERLVQEVRAVLAITNATKVNLIGYSQGGQTARYVAAAMPDEVASVTTVASPTGGSAVAQFLAEDDSQCPYTFKCQLTKLLSLATQYLSVVSQTKTDLRDALADLTPAGAALFNQQYPRGVPAQPCAEGEPRYGQQYYFSWGGVGSLTNTLDPTDPTFLMTSLLFKAPNDGMVGRCENHFGAVIRDDFHANHFDQINQIFGLTAWTGFSPKSIYRTHANRLKNLGL